MAGATTWSLAAQSEHGQKKPLLSRTKGRLGSGLRWLIGDFKRPGYGLYTAWSAILRRRRYHAGCPESVSRMKALPWRIRA